VNDHLLPRFRAHQEAVTVLDGRRERAPKQVPVDDDEEQSGTAKEERTKPGDPRKLRGIPVIARGVGGASPGTNPLAAWLRKEAHL
jgi:hypothetical protein